MKGLSLISTVTGRLGRDEAGDTAIEYGLVAGLIGVVIITALLALGPEMDTNFSTIATSFDNGTAAEDGVSGDNDGSGQTGGGDDDAIVEDDGFDEDEPAGTASGDGKNDAVADSGSGSGQGGTTAGAGREAKAGGSSAAGGASGGSGASGTAQDGGGSADEAGASVRGTQMASSTVERATGASFNGGAPTGDGMGTAKGAGPDVGIGGSTDSTEVDAAALALVGGEYGDRGESPALATKKHTAPAGTAGKNGTARRRDGATHGSGGGSQLANLLILLIGLAGLVLVAWRMLQNMARESQRKREMTEWNEAKSSKEGAAKVRVIRSGSRAAA